MFSFSKLQKIPSPVLLRPVLRKWHSTPLRLQIYVIAATITCLVILKSLYSFHFDHEASTMGQPILDTTQAAHNKTLGFGKVLYISLPHRTDRQDAMELLAATSNITLTYQPGVIGSKMHDKAKNADNGWLRDEQWGCWRSHADAWKKVVNENIETALIMEDDVDWDENVHDVFYELSKQLRRGKLRQKRMSADERRTAPYGERAHPSVMTSHHTLTASFHAKESKTMPVMLENIFRKADFMFLGLDWDVLYVGSCWDVPRDPHPKHVTYDDPHAPGRANLTQEFINELENWGVRVRNTTHKRILAPSWYPICTIGYAVTQVGAQRLLYNVGGVKGIGSAVDLAMNDQVKKGFLRGYTVVPPLLTPWKTGGVLDSDIDDMKEKEKELKEGEKLEVGSRNLWRSARARMNETLGNIVDT